MREPKPPDPGAVADRLKAEGIGRAIRDHLGDPGPGTFADGVEAHVAYRKRLLPDSEDAWELGYYDPDARLGDSVHLDGEAPRKILFPGWWRAWFARQSQRTLRVLDKIIEWLDEHGEDEAEKRLADLDEIIDRHRARKRLVARIVWVVKHGGPIAGLIWAVVTFFSARIGKFVEQLPVLRAAWKAIMGLN